MGLDLQVSLDNNWRDDVFEIRRFWSGRGERQRRRTNNG